jgi:DNA integrity scanning protein DisA with diadenylate cyclase activity
MEAPKILDLFCDICTQKRGINHYTLESVILLAVDIAREGREGRKIGTMFVVSDHEQVMKLSRNMILDPLLGHPPENKHIDDPNVRETLKELAQLDGAFVVSDDGIVVSACRYIFAHFEGIKLPLGLGSRHIAGASITKATKAIAVVVSESSVVRVFDNGEMIGEILPELWLLKRYGLHIDEPYVLRKKGDIAVVSKDSN